MGTEGATTTSGNRSLPDGVIAVSLLHYGLGGLLVLVGVASLVGNPILGIIAAVLGGLFLQIGHGLRAFRRSAWRKAIVVHGIDLAVGLFLLASGGVGEHLLSIGVSGGVIGYLSVRRDRYRRDTAG